MTTPAEAISGLRQAALRPLGLRIAPTAALRGKVEPDGGSKRGRGKGDTRGSLQIGSYQTYPLLHPVEQTLLCLTYRLQVHFLVLDLAAVRNGRSDDDG